MIGNREHKADRMFAVQMPLGDAALKDLGNRIGGDEAEAFQLRVLAGQNLCRAVPPIHHEIGAVVHVLVYRPESLGIKITQFGANILAADKGRIADNKFRLRPFGAARLWCGFRSLALNGFKLRRGVSIPCQHRIKAVATARIDVFKRLQNRLGWMLLFNPVMLL